MLVTFPVHGSAGTLAAFQQDKFPQTYSRHQARTNQQARLRKRSRVDAGEANGYSLQYPRGSSGRNGEEHRYKLSSITSSSLHHLRGAIVDSAEDNLIRRYAALYAKRRRVYLNQSHLEVGKYEQEAHGKRHEVHDQTSDSNIRAKPLSSSTKQSSLSHQSPSYIRHQSPIGIDPRLLTKPKSQNLPIHSIGDTNNQQPTSDHSVCSSSLSKKRDHIEPCQAILEKANLEPPTQASTVPPQASPPQTHSSLVDIDTAEVTDYLLSGTGCVSMSEKDQTPHSLGNG